MTGLTAGKVGSTAALTLNFYPCLQVTGGSESLLTSCASGNNGLLRGESISIPGWSATQKFTYDPAGRLNDIKETKGTTTLSETYKYSNGNRWVQDSTFVSLNTETPQAATWFGTDNRITPWTTDSAGNIQAIPSIKTFKYDAEGRQTSASVTTGTSTVITTTYTYDAEGRRVQKTTSAGTTNYVYDAQGNLVAEYGPADPNAGCGSTVCYVTVDHLGSTRLVTDNDGTPKRRYDYSPWGVLLTGINDRTDALGYLQQTDTFNPRFTGQMRDPETGLDYFKARYYSPLQGRFQSPDPGNAGADPAKPQTWNMYAYVNNSPTNYTDPSGRMFLAGAGIGAAAGGPVGAIIGGIASGLSALFALFGGGAPPPPSLGPVAGDISGPLSGPTYSTTGWCYGCLPSRGLSLPWEVAAAGGAGGAVIASNFTFSVTSTAKSSPSTKGPTFTKTYLPPNANICSVNQMSFYAPPSFDITKIEAAGKSGGYSPVAMNAAVGHYGRFDFQRVRDSVGNTTFYSGYTPVSNFSVGVYLYSAGFSKSVASFISNTFALFKSSNAGDPAQATFRNLGYDSAARGQIPVCQAR